MNDVVPKRETIDGLFSNEQYHIDFYQRQYKWNDEPVTRLLDDVFRKFNEEYDKHKTSELSTDCSQSLRETIESYSWYYLNTCVINRVDGKLYVVDGQQRLTTLTLILMKLRHLSMQFGSAPNLTDLIGSKIRGASGFWMNHEEHHDAMSDLYENGSSDRINKTSGLTAQNMVKNYRIISSWLDKEFKSSQRKFECFVYYFLDRLVIINLDVGQADCPMIFEVINDRGVKLKPYEILKGLLLGYVNKEDLADSNLNQRWEGQVAKINAFNNADNEKDKIDEFFVDYLKAKFANSAASGKKYDNNYHRVILSKDGFDIDRNNPSKAVEFLKNEFTYYTDLYKKVLDYYSVESLPETDDNFPSYVYFNKLTKMNNQFLLILSSCSLNDHKESEKIGKIAYEVDRLYCLLQLQGRYDSNEFNKAIYKLSSSIRNGDISVIRDAFDKTLTDLLYRGDERRIKSPLYYPFFKGTGYEDSNKHFIRYFFARIEKFIADSISRDLRKPFDKLVNGNSYHIEHIIGDNDKCLNLFDGDVDRFEKERNRLGGLLLLRRKFDSLKDERNDLPYNKKLVFYEDTLLWNETLCRKCYKQNNNFAGLKKYGLKIEPMSAFGPDELKERHELLFNMVKLIWK
jgi:uncharacterized protein with ParB-like and HNH nuclease domain